MNSKSTMLRGTLGEGMVRFFAIDSTDMVTRITSYNVCYTKLLRVSIVLNFTFYFSTRS